MNPTQIATVGKALGHRSRVRIVTALAMKRAMVLDEHDGNVAELAARDFALSPTALAERLGIPLGHLSYHVRILHEFGALALVGQEPARGALEHFYVLTPFGREVADMAARLAR